MAFFPKNQYAEYWDIEAEASPKINPKIRGLNFAGLT